MTRTNTTVRAPGDRTPARTAAAMNHTIQGSTNSCGSSSKATNVARKKIPAAILSIFIYPTASDPFDAKLSLNGSVEFSQADGLKSVSQSRTANFCDAVRDSAGSL